MKRPEPTGRCRALFAPSNGTHVERIGLELEFIPVDLSTGHRCPIFESTLPILRRVAAAEGWTERPSPYGAPVFVASDGAHISYEPGGQIEYSAAPSANVSVLTASLASTVMALVRAARGAGIELLTVGIDPYNDIGEVPLQLRG